MTTFETQHILGTLSLFLLWCIITPQQPAQVSFPFRQPAPTDLGNPQSSSSLLSTLLNVPNPKRDLLGYFFFFFLLAPAEHEAFCLLSSPSRCEKNNSRREPNKSSWWPRCSDGDGAYWGCAHEELRQRFPQPRALKKGQSKWNLRLKNDAEKPS